MKKYRKINLVILSTFVMLCFETCGVYSFTGASTGDAKSFQVNFFQNNADLVEPGIDRQFTDALQILIVNQTNLNLVMNGGDLLYEGEIIEYRISPMTATANNTAAQNRLTISVNVRYYDNLKDDDNFERRFSFFYDYPANAQLTGSVKETALSEIFERITQDIFNASLANW